MGNIELFDQIAAHYDTPERVRVAKAAADALRSRISGASGRTAIDFGCGTGLIGFELRDCFDAITFVDASQAMVDRVRQTIDAKGIASASAVCADVTVACPQDLRADSIMAVQVLLHIRDTEALLQCLYGMLHPGGHLLIVDYDRNESVQSELIHPGFEQAELRAMLKRVGFAHVESATFYSGEKLLMNCDASLFWLDAVRGA